jgi:hypothetical protein
MNYILVILIACALVYTLAYRLGVRRGRKESGMHEYRRGYRAGYDQSRKDLSELFRLEDEDLLLRIRELRKTAGQ